MKVTFRALNPKETFTVDIDESITVRTLKEKIQSEKGDVFSASLLKLIYGGKILEDHEVVSSYDIDEKKFIVVMVTKPKAETGGQNEPSTSDNKQPDSGQSSAGGSQKIHSAASKLLLGPEYEKAVETIVAMGFPRDQVEKALRASYNDTERAIDYLINGIPENLPDRDQSSMNPPSSAGSPNRNGTENPFAFLNNQPHFQQLKQIVRQDPTALDGIVQMIGQIDPQMVELVADRYDDLVALLMEEDDDAGQETNGVNAGTNAQVAGGGTGAQNDETETVEIQLTPEDRQAIARLAALGFPEELVVQAYFACDKNEELAADFLISETQNINNNNNS